MNTPFSIDTKCLLLAFSLSMSATTQAKVGGEIDAALGCPPVIKKETSPEEKAKLAEISRKLRTIQKEENIPEGMKGERYRHDAELGTVRGIVPRAFRFSDSQKLLNNGTLTPVRPGLGLGISKSLGQSVCANEEQRGLLQLLTPRTADVLYLIGNAFHHTFGAKLMITSMNRNHDYVQALRKMNGNAAAESSHEYGTTFDISYFGGITGNNPTFIPIEQRKFLEKILSELQQKGIIYVTKERYQSCYHVFVNPGSKKSAQEVFNIIFGKIR